MSIFFQEASIKPSDESVFPGADWLIGNHSDELTPWIPMMAARFVPHTFVMCAVVNHKIHMFTLLKHFKTFVKSYNAKRCILKSLSP